MRALGDEVSQLPELPIDVLQVILEYISRTFNPAEFVTTTDRLAHTSQSWKEAVKTQDEKNWQCFLRRVPDDVEQVILNYISRTFNPAEVVITTAWLAQTSQSWKEAVKLKIKRTGKVHGNKLTRQ